MLLKVSKSCVSAEISECQDGYYKQGAQCLQCSNNCAPNTICNKDTGKCYGKNDFVCIMGRNLAMASRGSVEEEFSVGVSPTKHLMQNVLKCINSSEHFVLNACLGRHELKTRLRGCLFNLVAFLSFTSYGRICEDFGFLGPVRCAVEV